MPWLDIRCNFLESLHSLLNFSFSGLLRHEHVVTVLAATGDDQGQLALRAQLADADEGVEALVSVLLDYLDVGGVHPIRGLVDINRGDSIVLWVRGFSLTRQSEVPLAHLNFLFADAVEVHVYTDAPVHAIC